MTFFFLVPSGKTPASRHPLFFCYTNFKDYSQLARSEDLTDVTVTNSGRIVGTLLYMPPEQARGDSRSLSTRSDIYAMGVILYEMITGKRPFGSTSSRTLIYSILTDEPARPHSIRKTIPSDIETICLKAMEKDPARRFGSAEEMAADLQRFVEGRPILARPISAPERIWRFARRNPMSSVLVAAIVPLITILIFLMLRPEKITIVKSDPVVEIVEAPPLAHPVRFRFGLSGNNEPPTATADWTILPMDKRTREPVAEAAIRIPATATPEQNLSPGEYLVIAHVPGFGFHEVYRYVPEDPSAATKAPYPHERWEVASDGVLEMPPINIQSEASVIAGMIRVPGGSFQMGDELVNKPQHARDVDDFLVDSHEVSADEFSRVIVLSSDYQFLRGNYAVCVQWNAAVAYAESMGKRLLKEHEFEYLASNLGKSDYPSGDAPVASKDEFWPYLEVGLPDTDRLASLPVFGLHSNVAEWTDSLINHYPGAMDPGPEADRFINKHAQRVVRGGPVKLGPNDRSQNKWDKSVRYRSAWEARTIDSEIGFRCCRSATPRFAAP